MKIDTFLHAPPASKSDGEPGVCAKVLVAGHCKRQWRHHLDGE